jgi:hypothetical protein
LDRGVSHGEDVATRQANRGRYGNHNEARFQGTLTPALSRSEREKIGKDAQM